MKTPKISILNLAAILSLLIITVNCSQDENSLQTPEEKNIQFLKTELGGCNDSEKSGEIIEAADTVIVNFSNDTLNIFAGINYICCAPFVTDCEVKSDSIYITISDTCITGNNSCYCRCYCYYTFDYYFENIGSKKYYWQIILNDPREEIPILLNSGEFGIVSSTK